MTASRATINTLKRGLEEKKKGNAGSGLEDETVREARAIISSGKITLKKAIKMRRWFGRNARFASAAMGTPARTAWLLWGGRSGRADANRVIKKAATEGRYKEDDQSTTTDNQFVPRSLEKTIDSKLGRKAPKSNTPASKKERRAAQRGKGETKSKTGSVASSIRTLLAAHNKSPGKGGKVSFSTANTIVRRGMAAFGRAHSPRVSSPVQWGLARLRVWLSASKTGRFRNRPFDTDLLKKEASNTKNNKRRDLN